MRKLRAFAAHVLWPSDFAAWRRHARESRQCAVGHLHRPQTHRWPAREARRPAVADRRRCIHVQHLLHVRLWRQQTACTVPPPRPQPFRQRCTPPRYSVRCQPAYCRSYHPYRHSNQCRCCVLRNTRTAVQGSPQPPESTARWMFPFIAREVQPFVTSCDQLCCCLHSRAIAPTQPFVAGGKSG